MDEIDVQRAVSPEAVSRSTHIHRIRNTDSTNNWKVDHVISNVKACFAIFVTNLSPMELRCLM